MGSYNGIATPLKIDHATGYLKAVITNVTLDPPTVSPDYSLRDDNQVTADTGVYNGSPKAILIQHSTGKLRAVIV